MYEKALATNQRLKSRLETSQLELAVVQDQLQKAQVLHCINSDIQIFPIKKKEP